MPNLSNFQLPDRKILILGATCLSIIAILLTYRIVEIKKTAKAEQALVATAGADEKSALADNRVLSALQETTLESLTSTSTNPFVKADGDSLSDRFSKNIVTAYAKYQAGYATEAEITNEVLGDINAASVAPKEKYSLSQVKVSSDSGANDIRMYANLFADQYLKAVDPVSKNTAKYKTDITAMTPIYKDLASRLMSIPVPVKLALPHLQLANAYAMQSDSFYLISGQEKDPVKALVGLNVLKNTTITQQNAFAQITKAIKESGIIFADNEPGRFFGTNPLSNSLSATSSTSSASAGASATSAQ